MFSTSGDILNLVLSVAIALFTIFLVTAIYYVISSLKKVHNLINQVEKSVTKAEEVIALIRGKIKGSSAYLMIIGEVLKQGIKMFQKGDFTSKKKETKKKK